MKNPQALARFGLVSILTTILDNLVFYTVFRISASVVLSQVVARLVALTFNYTVSRSAVFRSGAKHLSTFPKYLGLVCLNGWLSYFVITFLIARSHLQVLLAKLIAESILFLVSFAIQRNFVFTSNRKLSEATNWSEYYRAVPPTAKLTRRYTTWILLWAFQKFIKEDHPTLVEIGGANSCFLDAILNSVRPKKVDIVDLNEYGLDLLQKRLKQEQQVFLHKQDCRTVVLEQEADGVFSVGLIEHFDPPSTRDAIIAHFRLVKPGGIVIVTFPTPTWLYRLTRAVCETLGLWKFPDERPLLPSEVISSVRECGTILFQKTLWPLVLTQHMIVACKDTEN